MAEDYYKILGVRRDASQADIQKAYREMARKYHPDQNPDDKGAKDKFVRIQKAFEVLNDSEKREMYDRYGSSFESIGAGGPRSQGWGAGPQGFRAEDIESQFFGQRYGEEPGGGSGDIFSFLRRATGGGARQRPDRAQRSGADIAQEMTIPFNVAVTGGEVQIAVARPSGKSDKISVKIPAGIEGGKKIRVRGQGEPGSRSGKSGDILLTIRVAPHPCFHRRGSHLHVKIPVSLAEAALGAKVDVPTPYGTVALSVPAGTSSGTRLRIKGHGAAPKDAPRGDLLAEIQIVLPEELEEADLRMIREIDERHPQDAREDLMW